MPGDVPSLNRPSPKRGRSASRTSRPSARGSANARRGGPSRAAIRERAAEIQQAELFGRAAGLFQEGKYGMARRVLDRVQSGPDTALCHRARVYMEVCKRRTARKRPKLETVEDYYNLAVRCVNDGAFDEAVRVCNRGIAKDASESHLHYIKAVAKVLAGQTIGGAASLRKAIALDPSIRLIAKGDPDLHEVIGTKTFVRITAPA